MSADSFAGRTAGRRTAIPSKKAIWLSAKFILQPRTVYPNHIQDIDAGNYKTALNSFCPFHVMMKLTFVVSIVCVCVCVCVWKSGCVCCWRTTLCFLFFVFFFDARKDVTCYTSTKKCIWLVIANLFISAMSRESSSFCVNSKESLHNDGSKTFWQSGVSCIDTMKCQN